MLANGRLADEWILRVGRKSMSRYDFSEIEAHYPEIIEQMEPVFTSHQFILKLAQQHQVLYIEALMHTEIP